MISTLIYIACLILISAAYIVSYICIRKRYAKRLDFEVDNYEHSREILVRITGGLEELISDLKLEIECKNDIIADLETKLLGVPTWRSSSVELPEVNDRMLVCSTTTKGEKRINIAWYDPLLCMWHGNGNLDNVIAWRPLPELPEFEDSAEGGDE